MTSNTEDFAPLSEMSREQARIDVQVQRNRALIHEHFVAAAAMVGVPRERYEAVTVDHAKKPDYSVVRVGVGLFRADAVHPIDPKMVELIDLLRMKEAKIAELEQRRAEDDGDWVRLAAQLYRTQLALEMMMPLVDKMFKTTNSRSEHEACQAALEAYDQISKPVTLTSSVAVKAQSNE